jgi:hypothetical protein
VGRESKCKLDLSGHSYEGKALLETSEIIFRGKKRLKIAFKDMTRVEAADGCLTIASPEGDATFHLGAAAEKWAAKILNPPTRLDKLGVREGTRIRWVGTADKEFQNDAKTKGASFVRTKPDLTFLAAEGPADLKKIDNPPVWIVFPKGVKQIREGEVLAAGRAAGLVDIKVASFSPTHTALKFVSARADSSPKRG